MMRVADIQKYEETLLDIKKRIEVVRVYVDKQRTTGFLITEVELLAIQFRKMIELIAFSSLIVNKDEYSVLRSNLNKDYKSDWNAKRIFEALEKINPHFYPEPSKQVLKSGKNGVQVVELKKITTGFLTKNEAIEVYDICSSVLHQGNPYAIGTDIKIIYAKFTEWSNKIVTLLSHHSIFLLPQKIIVSAEMQSLSTGQPKVFIFSEMSKKEISSLPPYVKLNLKDLGLKKYV